MSNLRKGHMSDRELSRILTHLAPGLFEQAQGIRQSMQANQNTTLTSMSQFLKNDTDMTLAAAPTFSTPVTTADKPLANNINPTLPHVFSGNADIMTAVGKPLHPTKHAFNMSKADTVVQPTKSTPAQNNYTAQGNVIYPSFSGPRFS